MIRALYKHLILDVSKGPAAGILKKHFQEVGERFVFCDKKNNPKGNLYTIARVVYNIEKPTATLDEHIHTVENLMIFIGFENNLSGLTAEVTLEGEKYIVDSPAVAYIPPGLKHAYQFVKGSGIYMNIVAAPGGDYNAVTE